MLNGLGYEQDAVFSGAAKRLAVFQPGLEVDLEHNILRPYKYFCEMLGYTADELIGKNALQLFVVEEYHDKMRTQDEIRMHGTSSVYEVQLKRTCACFEYCLLMVEA